MQTASSRCLVGRKEWGRAFKVKMGEIFAEPKEPWKGEVEVIRQKKENQQKSFNPELSFPSGRRQEARDGLSVTPFVRLGPGSEMLPSNIVLITSKVGDSLLRVLREAERTQV